MPANKAQPYLLQFSRLICGMVFVYSGFVKAIDPLGSTYKFGDYFAAFGIGFLEPVAFPLSVGLSSAELIIGTALLAGTRMIIASWALLFFMVFFTTLTFFIALTNPVADCGCFGDAIILSNWETFWKNVILMVFVIHLFVKRKVFKPVYAKPVFEWIAVTGFVAITALIIMHSYRNLPVIDYRPFSIGTDINEKMSVPPDAPADEYEITLWYQKDGETRAFDIDNIPGSDWEWVRTESTLISKGYEPEISNFVIESAEDGADMTWEILNDPGYTFLLVSYNLDKSSGNAVSRINRLAEWSAGMGVNFICLTASTYSQIENFRKETGAEYEFYQVDEITLKTIIRSNPGLVLLREGTVIGKWHHRNIPHSDEVKDNLLSWAMEIQQKSRNRAVSLGYLLGLFLTCTLAWSLRPTAAATEETTRNLSDTG